jgi:protein gp37
MTLPRFAKRRTTWSGIVGEKTTISWTHHTFNPWWGCARVSPGCEHCYAESFAKRTGNDVWGVHADRRRFNPETLWAKPVAWDKAAAKIGERHRVFCASMADVFEDRVDHVEDRARLFDVIDRTPNLDWLLLTKRPENMTRLAPESWRAGWPKNVWAGTTVEDQKRRSRIAHLQAVPATTRFLSCEPLLEAVDLRGHLDGIDWVIVGGESGPGARPFETEWTDVIIREARLMSVAVHVKQMGAKPMEGGARLKLRDKKGGDWTEWRPDLRVREYPVPVLP